MYERRVHLFRVFRLIKSELAIGERSHLGVDGRRRRTRHNKLLETTASYLLQDIIMVLAKAAHFIAAASPIMNNIPRADPEAYNERDFRSIFGTTPQVCSILWNMLDPAGPDSPLLSWAVQNTNISCGCYTM